MESDKKPLEETAATQAPAEDSPVTAKEKDAPAFTVSATDAPKKKEKKKKTDKEKKRSTKWIILGSAAAVLVALCVIFWSFIASFYHRTFLSPEDYLQKMERRAVAKNAEKLADAYQELLDKGLQLENGNNIDARIHLEDTALDILQPYAPEEFGDCAWLRDSALNISTVTGEDSATVTVVTALDQGQLLTLKIDFDLKKNVVYIAIPELHETPLRFDLEPETAEYLASALSDSEANRQFALAVFKCLPDRDTFRDMLVEYADIVISGLNDVEKEQTRIYVGEKSRKVTALTAKITESDQCDIYIAILKKAQSDPRIATFLKDLTVELKTACPQAKTEDLYAVFTSGVTDTITQLEEQKKNANPHKFILSTTYVDYMDNIIGRKIVTADKDIFTEEFHYHIVAKSRKNMQFEVYLNVTEDFRHPESLLLTGSYRKNKDGIHITCDAQKNGAHYLSAKLENFAEKAGTLRLEPGKTLLDEFQEAAGLKLPTALLGDNLAFEIQFNIKEPTKKIYDIRMTLGGKTIATVDLTHEKMEAEPDVPTYGVRTDNQLSLGLWAMKADFNGCLQKLEDGGVPKEVVDLIKESLFDYSAGQVIGK